MIMSWGALVVRQDGFEQRFSFSVLLSARSALARLRCEFNVAGQSGPTPDPGAPSIGTASAYPR